MRHWFLERDVLKVEATCSIKLSTVRLQFCLLLFPLSVFLCRSRVRASVHYSLFTLLLFGPSLLSLVGFQIHLRTLALAHWLVRSHSFFVAIRDLLLPNQVWSPHDSSMNRSIIGPRMNSFLKEEYFYFCVLNEIDDLWQTFRFLYYFTFSFAPLFCCRHHR